MNETNKKYKSLLNLLSIDDILLKKVKIKEIKKPEWSQKNILKEWNAGDYGAQMYILPEWIDDEHVAYEESSIHTKKIDRRYFIYKNQKLCLVEVYSDIKKIKPLEKIIYTYRTDEEMDRDRYAIDDRSNAQLHGEQISYYLSGEIKESSINYYERKVGVYETFHKNGHLYNWKYFKAKKLKNYLKENPPPFSIEEYGLEFCFWENGNLRFIAKFDEDHSETYSFITFNINEDEEFVGTRTYAYQPMGSKTHRRIEIFRKNGKKLTTPKRTRDIGISGTSPLYNLKEEELYN